MAESDLFFRIKAGQEILARHGLPGRNLFSFTYPDAPGVDAAWLFEVGAAARRLALAAVVAAAALFATPIGFGLLRYLRLHLSLPALHPVDEFRSPTWLSDAALYVYGAAIIASFGVLLLRVPGRRIVWAQ